MSGDCKPAAGDAPLEVFVYYDFASSLSYVAHRVLARIDEPLAAERVDLRWKAIDLTGVGNFQRGRLLDPARRQSLLRVAAALDVDFDPPEYWLDSRLAGEVAVVLDERIDRGLDPAIEREWRAAAFEAYYERRSEIEDLLRDFGRRTPFPLGAAADLAAGRRLTEVTRSAVAAGVEGVPTLMLDVFPLCGIHDEETMLGMIRRYARRRRRLKADAAVGVN
ncbi:MAG: DsbA family protein [Acidobacteria bacterium]|nr:DsbA family protein [Acidobacteriota bacterium]